MKKTIRLSLLAAFLFQFVSAIAQQPAEIIGKIIGSDGLETPGATVIVKGASIGTVADYNGNYKIKVPDNRESVLVFTYVGMKAKEIRVNGKTLINVELEQDAIMLDEFVSVGYGTVRRSDLTGSISSVRGEAISAVPVTSVAQALAGKVAGVSVTQSDGSPDAAMSIRVRGGLSITQDNEPLYIIDGFPSEVGMAGLDPNDIASIDVLKDASATAIYGARGGNGVILITTKAGYEGKATVNYDMYYGIKMLTNRMPVLNSDEFVRLEYERSLTAGATEQLNFLSMYGDYYDTDDPDLPPIIDAMYASFKEIGQVYGNRPGVDWQGLVFDDALPSSQNHRVSISGGTKTTQYSASYSHSNDEGIMLNSGLVRNNIRLQMTQNLSDKLRFTANVTHVNEKTTGMGSLSEQSYFSRMAHIIQYRPIYGKYLDDKDLIGIDIDPILDAESGSPMQNPLVSNKHELRSIVNVRSIFNSEIVYNINKNLTYRGSVGYSDRMYNQDLFYEKGSSQVRIVGSPYGQRDLRQFNTLNYNNVLTYNLRLPSLHSFNIMLGQESYSIEYNRLFVKSTNFPDDNFGLNDMSLGETPDRPITDAFGERTFSFFGRTNYNYKQRYLATVTLRADGSSKFGANNKWGYFPSASFAWRLSEEDFVKELNAFSNMKLRLSYGAAGNNRIGTFRSLSRMNSSWMPFENTTNVSYLSSQLPNPDLKWESNVSANAGIDLGFFDQRLQLVVDVYNNQTHNLLLESRVPLLSGYATTLKNIGKTQNRGAELTINTVNVQNKNFRWETSFNISTNRNKVLQLSGTDFFTTRSGWVSPGEFNEDDYRIEVGQPLGNMYGYRLIGLYTVDDFDYDAVTNKYILKEGIAFEPDNYPKPGYNKFENTFATDSIIDSKDKQVIGNASPDFIGGFMNSITYKNFDFSFALNFSIGNDVYNANNMFFTKTSNRYRNALSFSAERFTYIDPETGMNVHSDPERLAEINVNNTAYTSVEGSNRLKFHSGYVEDASFLRLTNMTFGYSLPKSILKKVGIANMRIYAAGYNLFLLTKYSGFDPEVNNRPNGGLTPGVDWGSHPRSMSMVVGANLSF